MRYKAGVSCGEAGPPTPTNEPSPRRWLAGVFAAALAARLVVLWSWQRSPLADCLGVDPAAFMASALRIAAGGWAEPHGLLVGGPLYPHFLGALVELLGPGTGALRLAQAAVGALGTTLVAALAARLFSRRTALLAALGAVLLGPLVASEMGFENEFLAVPLAAGALLLLSPPRRTWRAPLAAGALLGLAALLRGNQLLVAVLATAWLAAARRPWRVAATEAALLWCGVALALAPNAARNLASLGEAGPLSAHGGYVFYLGHHEGASWRYAPVGFGDTTVAGEAPAAIAEASRRAGRPLTPGEASRYWLGEGLRFVAARPGAAAANAGLKLLAFFHPGELPDNYDLRFLREQVPPLRALFLTFGIVAPLAAIGAARVRTRAQVLVLLPIAAALITVVAFYYNARFRLPAAPFAMILAAEGAVAVATAVRARDGRALRGVGLAAAAALALAAASPPFRDDFYFPWVLAARCASAAEPARAEALFRRAIDLHPREPEARVGLARLLAARGDPGGARETLAPVLAHPPALLLLASVEAAEGRDDAAIAALDAALAREPALTSAWNDLGVLHARSGRLEPAGAAFARALALAPDDPDVLRNSATLRLDAGDAAGALGDAERALSRREDKDLRLLAGAAALRAGAPERARRHLADARRLGATRAEIEGALR